jgi:hypothetical protein
MRHQEEECISYLPTLNWAMVIASEGNNREGVKGNSARRRSDPLTVAVLSGVRSW